MGLEDLFDKSELEALKKDILDKGITKHSDLYKYIHANFDYEECGSDFKKVLKEKKGDCGTLSTLLYILLKDFGYNANIIRFDGDDHVIVSVEERGIYNYYDCVNNNLEFDRASEFDNSEPFFKGEIIVETEESLKLWYEYLRYYEGINKEKDLASKVDCVGKATKCLCEYIKLQPNCCDARVNIGGLLFKYKMYSEAVEFFKNAIAINGNHPRVYLGLGYCLFKLKKYDEAIKELNKVIELNPINPKVYLQAKKIRSLIKEWIKGI